MGDLNSDFKTPNGRQLIETCLSLNLHIDSPTRITKSTNRPISLLSVTSKIKDRIIFKHIYNFFHFNTRITIHQSGFRPNDCTVNQLAYLYHIISKALHEIRIVFCDVSKAFDKVWQDGILFKLNQLGVTGNLHTWVHDYMSNRKQKVVIQGQQSE